MYNAIALYFFFKLLSCSLDLEESKGGQFIKNIFMIMFSTFAIVWGINGGKLQ